MGLRDYFCESMLMTMYATKSQGTMRLHPRLRSPFGLLCSANSSNSATATASTTKSQSGTFQPTFRT